MATGDDSGLAPSPSRRPTVSRRGRWPGVLLALVTGIACALVVTWPLAPRLGSAIITPKPECASCPESPDALLCVWITGEAGRRLLRHPLRLFDAGIFHPLRGTLAFSESLLSAAVLVGPLNAITGNPVLGHNLYIVSTIAVGAVGMFLLVQRVTGVTVAAWLAALAFGLARQRTPWLTLPTALGTQWTAFVLWSVLRLLDAPSPWRGLQAAAFLALHMHAGAYAAFTFPLLVLPWGLVLLIGGQWGIRRWLAAGAVLACGFVVALVGYLPYLEVQDIYGYSPGLLYIFVILGPELLQAFLAPTVYFGLDPSVDRSLFAVSPVPLILFPVALVLGRRARQGELFHAVAAFAIAVGALSLSGTIMVLWGYAISLPFQWLTLLPGFGSIREPTRLVNLMPVGTSIVLGIAVARLVRRTRGRTVRWALVAAIAAVTVLDARSGAPTVALTTLPTTADRLPAYDWLAAQPRDEPILEMPYGFWQFEARYMVMSLYHGHPLMNGYSAVIPTFVDPLRRFPDDLAMRTLADAGIRYVLLHGLADSGTQRKIAAVWRKGGLRWRRLGETVVVEVPPAAAVDPLAGRPIPADELRLDADDAGAERAADGSLGTHWIGSTTGRASELRVDLGRERNVSGIVLRLGRHVMEYPRRMDLAASPDGVAWEVVLRDYVVLPPFASYREDPERVEVPIALPAIRARALALRVPEERPDDFFRRGRWGVHELTVMATDGPSGAAEPERDLGPAQPHDQSSRRDAPP